MTKAKAKEFNLVLLEPKRLIILHCKQIDFHFICFIFDFFYFKVLEQVLIIKLNFKCT